jgi:hypothetical protein
MSFDLLAPYELYMIWLSSVCVLWFKHNGQKKDRQHIGQKKDRQHNGQKKKDKQHNGQKKNVLTDRFVFFLVLVL